MNKTMAWKDKQILHEALLHQFRSKSHDSQHVVLCDMLSHTTQSFSFPLGSGPQSLIGGNPAFIEIVSCYKQTYRDMVYKCRNSLVICNLINNSAIKMVCITKYVTNIYTLYNIHCASQNIAIWIQCFIHPKT